MTLYSELFCNFAAMKHVSLIIRFVAAVSMCVLAACSSHKDTAAPVTPGRGHGGDLHAAYINNNSFKLMRQQESLIEEALTWIGTPYSYGCCSKGKATDCSGFVMEVYNRALSTPIPRNSARQLEHCKELRGKDVRPGDLVFFATGKDSRKVNHVGIMLDTEDFIHASSKKGVIVSHLSSPYYQRTFVCFGRVPGMKW